LLFGDYDDPQGINTLMDISITNERTRNELLEERAQLYLFLFQAQAENNTRVAASIQNRIQSLNERISRLVILKSDIIKWPHHAHRFPNNETVNNIIRKMNEAVDPRYIIWESHSTQRNFIEYIQRFDFNNKFLSSDEVEIQIISILPDAIRMNMMKNLPWPYNVGIGG
jgi:hypothetical protein